MSIKIALDEGPKGRNLIFRPIGPNQMRSAPVSADAGKEVGPKTAHS